MGDRILYCCPEHPDEVLKVDDSSMIKMMVMERPMICPRCRKSYYEWQCVIVEDDDE